MNGFSRYAGCFVSGCLLGWYLHWSATRPVPVMVHATPEKRLPAGGLQLASAINPEAVPGQPMPAGAKVLHVGRLVVAPRKKTKPSARKENAVSRDVAGRAEDECPPVEVKYTLYASASGQEFMRTSSPQGVVTEGEDAIVQARYTEAVSPWGVGLGLDGNGHYGARADYDLQGLPLRVGVDLRQTEDGGFEPWAWVLLTL